jgi:hypothetical protein
MNWPLTSLLTLLCAGLLIGCPTGRGDDDDDAQDDDDAAVDFRLWSDELLSDDGIEHTYDCDQSLPPEHSCWNPNPAISWEGAPAGTVAFTLIFDDPTAGDWEHWAVYNIPASADGLAAAISGDGATGSLPDGAVELDNGTGDPGYFGSCPGAVNLYRWRLWAMTELLTDHPANYAQLAGDAEAVSAEMTEMCHVFDGDDADLRR